MVGAKKMYNMHSFNIISSISYIYLYFFICFYCCRLGLANRPQCEQALQKTGWSLELAAAVLLESTS